MTRPEENPVIVWFRRDLRVADNHALAAAIATGRPIIPCYVRDDANTWAPGAAGRWWLHHSLSALDAEFSRRGGRLILRSGDAAVAIGRLAAEARASAVYASALPAPEDQARDADVAATLATTGVQFARFEGGLLFGADPVRTKAGSPFQVFTPFYKACLDLPEPAPPIAAPELIRFCDHPLDGDALADWSLVPVRPNWASGFEPCWRPGEAGATARLERFIATALERYGQNRDRPDREGTSRLSPHLAFGELSPAQVWHAARIAATTHPRQAQAAAAWLRQLIWREFSYYLLHHWPRLPTRPFREAFERFPWTEDEAALGRWQHGATGYPLVDAGMRELWRTGWMHNRVRMIVASFLVKDLLVPWQQGAAWFLDTLVDADVANNSAGWQWVAGCGADAAPYFRIFNPVLQARKFDPTGDYIRRYVPELAALPDRYVHSPGSAPGRVLDAAGIVPGRDYPLPIVDHASARRRALAHYASLGR